MALSNLIKDKIFIKYLKSGHFKVYKDGRVLNTKTGNYVGTKPNSRGYGVVSQLHKGKIIHIQVHRLIWIALNGPITDPEAQINHDDGNKMNNNPKNHVLTTPSGNTQHAVDRGLIKPLKGESNGFSSLTQKQVNSLRREYLKKPFSIRERSKILGVARQTLSSALKGQTYEGEGITLKMGRL